MKAQLITFGEIEIDGKRYDHDIVIEQGAVRKRSKQPSKVHREHYQHTPLSYAEQIPWHGSRLYVGTGMYGALPIMPEVFTEAEKRGVEVVVEKTEAICRLLEECRPEDVNAILHVTC